MSTRTLVIATALLTVMGAASARAADIRVPEDVKSYRKALRRARPGDVVILAPGSYAGRLTVRRRGVTVRGEGAVFSARKNGAKVVVIRGKDAAVEGVTVENGTVLLKAAGAAVRGLHLRGLVGRSAISVRAADAQVEDNHFEPITYTETGEAVVLVLGDRAVVTGNTAEAVLFADAQLGPRGQNDFIRVVGDDAHVSGNAIDVSDGTTGVRVVGDRATVSDNRLDWGPDGIVVTGNTTTVSGNTVTNGFGVAIEVVGDDATLTDNVAEGRAGDGLRVVGSFYTIVDNEISMGVPTLPQPSLITRAPLSLLDVANYDGPPVGVVISPGALTDPDVTVGCPAIVIRSEELGGVVEDNTIEYSMGAAVNAVTSGATLRGNTVRRRGAAPGVFAFEVVGTGNLISANSLSSGAVVAGGFAVRGASNVVESNEFVGLAGHAILTTGGSNTIDGNRIFDPRRLGSWNALIDIFDNDNLVLRNVIEDRSSSHGSTSMAPALHVTGDNNLIEANRMQGLAAMFSMEKVWVGGSRNVVRRNVLVACGHFGVIVGGSGNTVEDNQAINAAAEPRPALVYANVQDWVELSADYMVYGTDNEVCHNGSDGAWGSGFLVEGDGNDIHDNETGNSVRHGFDVRGDGNRVHRNQSFDVGKSGFVVPYGNDNSITDCVATGSGACGLEAGGKLTSLIRDTFTGSAVHDVQITGTLSVFEGNVFDTILEP